jgi:sterol desaturase/sphingolipid hydroxylase (fatty acid hydroxylase superfamily)
MARKEVSVQASGGISLATILVLIFMTLKLMGEITWSWWWVFAPWWIPAAIVATLFVLALLLAIFFGDD